MIDVPKAPKPRPVHVPTREERDESALSRVARSARLTRQLLDRLERRRLAGELDSEVWADMVRLFGRQHTIDLLGIMGDYLRVGIMLNAVNQQQPASRPALLPPLDPKR